MVSEGCLEDGPDVLETRDDVLRWLLESGVFVA